MASYWARGFRRTVVFSRSTILLHDATVLFIVFTPAVTGVVIGGVFALVFRFALVVATSGDNTICLVKKAAEEEAEEKRSTGSRDPLDVCVT